MKSDVILQFPGHKAQAWTTEAECEEALQAGLALLRENGATLIGCSTTEGGEIA